MTGIEQTMSRLWKALLIIHLLFSGLLAAIPVRVYAQTEVVFESRPPKSTFGENILFQANLQSNIPVVKALLMVQNGSEVQVVPANLDQEGNLAADYSLKTNPLRAFSQIKYWFQLALQNGETYTSPKNTFLYSDNRFDWETIENAPLRIHWHTGDTAFAQEVLNISQAGIKRAQQILPIILVPPVIDIYVYQNAEELRSALVASSQNWIAGHADPDLNVILVSLPPGPEQRLEMERQIPHELMHVMLYYTDGNAYTNLPAWFNEGLSSLAELYPNPDYPVLLQNAYQTNSLLPLETLCKVFPKDSHKALLAYAESASFMNFLFEKYGHVGFESLMALYAHGQSCDQAVETGFNASLSNLENQWQRQNFVRNSAQTALQDLLPWLMVILIVLAGPFILAINLFRHRAVRADL